MNIDDDYLWDKTGEPDPEVKQLEEILGTLRYEPRPLEIPAGRRIARERSFFRDLAPRLAIAATIVMLLLGLGLWLGLQRLQRNQPPEIVKTEDTPAAKPNTFEAPSPNHDHKPVFATTPGQDKERNDRPPRRRIYQSLLAENTNRTRKEARSGRIQNPQLVQKDQQEAETAKDQLMLALRVASAKFGLAQRKVQELNQREPVHNQHKIG